MFEQVHCGDRSAQVLYFGFSLTGLFIVKMIHLSIVESDAQCSCLSIHTWPTVRMAGCENNLMV